ncbi:MAG TPA: hemerythrin domain-containing protein [Pseudonocardiaceae bacterium]|nr:hemerythrin domain-containing protein [Pseudonocardiaceae bacterium]
MPTRDQVRQLLEQGHDYPEIARRLGVPPGQVYLIGTGMPADGGDTYTDAERQRPGVLPTAQHLLGLGAENPTTKQAVLNWIKARVAADAQMQAAAQQRDAEPGEIADPDGDHDALVVLTRDHNQVKALQEQLEALPSHTTGGSTAQVSQRKSIVDMITVKLSEHEAVEEQYFWPAVREALPDGDRWADEAIEQEQQGKDTLTALGELEPDTDEFDELVDQLVLLLRKHVAYEEKLFLVLKSVMPDEARRELGKELLAAKKLAPTRPHPHTPASPDVLKTAGLAAAAVDKVRDAVGDRPAKRRGKSNKPQ